MKGDYDLQSIYEAMEDEIINSYRRNLAKHTTEEVAAGFQWPMWQALKLQDLKSFESDVAGLLKKYGKQANTAVQQEIKNSFSGGATNADQLLKDIDAQVTGISDGSFFKSNERQIAALQNAVSNDLTDAQHAVLRMSNDVFRSTIYKAQTFYNSGVSTLWKSVDMASQDFLNRGLNCIQYKNGARVNIASYAEMALRASSKKAYMVGEGSRSAEYGVTLCQVTQYSACSPTCRPWQGRIYVDDVYAGGSPDGKHRLLSQAIDGGLFHPNCRHIKQPYYEGISEQLTPISGTESGDNYEAEQQQRGIERNIRKFKRRVAGSLDPKVQEKAQLKVDSWQQKMREHLNDNPQLRRESAREKVYA